MTDVPASTPSTASGASPDTKANPVGRLPLNLTSNPEADARRRKELRKMRLVATGLLVFAAIVYILTRHLDGFWGYVNTGAEASMVGACADWFAVTALFRHPLGLPIPHTALIPKRKDEIGRSLEEFVGENFLQEDIIRERVLDASVTAQACAWVLTDGRAQRVVGEVCEVLAHGLSRVPDEDVEAIVAHSILPRLKAEPIAGLGGVLLDQVIADRTHTGLVDLGLDEMERWLREHRETFVAIIVSRAPKWVPDAVNDLVGSRVHREALTWVRDIKDDPDHEVRRALDDLLRQLAHDLQHDTATQERAERLKERLLDHPQVLASGLSLWRSARAILIDALRDPTGAIRQRLESEVIRLAHTLQEDDGLRARVDRRIADAAVYFTSRYGAELTQVISQTVDRWDGVETAERVELQVGKDLQYIRINGTIVGGLIGVLIHAVSQLIG